LGMQCAVEKGRRQERGKLCMAVKIKGNRIVRPCRRKGVGKSVTMGEGAAGVENVKKNKRYVQQTSAMSQQVMLSPVRSARTNSNGARR